jgi:TolB-like protein/DNA-binding winged helix-turn-helix (wHTH) protein/Tfp pilus assembly protein PilF
VTKCVCKTSLAWFLTARPITLTIIQLFPRGSKASLSQAFSDMKTITSQTASFGPYALDLRSGELRKFGTRVKMGEQTFQILRLLLEAQGELVSREELRAKLWADDTFVDFDHGLNSAIQRVRDCLSDSAETTRWVETVPRRGYRFVGQVEWSERAIANGGTHETSQAETAVGVEAPAAEPLTSRFAARVALRYGLTFLATASVAVMLLLAFQRGLLRQLPWGAAGVPRIKSLAVLPLHNLSDDTEQEYFSDGMTDELITELAKVRTLRVISHSSVQRYKETKRPLSEIARELGVDAVVEGTVMRAGDRVRITAQLIDGRSDQHLWAQSYERDLRDVLGLQNEVARQIATAVGINLATGWQAVPAIHRNVDADAHEAYLRGVFYWNRWDCDGFKKGLEYFQQSVDKDSHFAPAYVGLAQSYFTLADFGCWPQDDALPKSKAAAMRALELDHDLGAAHVWLGNHAFYFERDWPRAEREFTQAIEQDPNYLPAHVAYAAFLVCMGRPEQGFVEMRRARELDPTSLTTNMSATYLLYLTRQFDQAIDQGRKTIELYPDLPAAYVWLAPSYEMKGMNDQAIDAHLKSERTWGATPEELSTIRNAYEKHGMRGYWNYELAAAKTRGEDKAPDKACWMAQIYAHLGMKERTLEYLNRALQSHCSDVATFNVDPLYDGMREDPAFRELIVRLRL